MKMRELILRVNTGFIALGIAFIVLLSSFGNGVDLSADFVEMAKAYANLSNKSFAIDMEIRLDDGQKSTYTGTVEIGVKNSFTDFMNTIRIISDEGYLMIDRANRRVYFNEKTPDFEEAGSGSFGDLEQLIAETSSGKIQLIESSDSSKKVRIVQPAQSDFTEIVLEYDLSGYLISSIEYRYRNAQESGVENVRVSYRVSDNNQPEKQDKWKRDTYIKKKSGSWVAQGAYNGFKVIDLTSKK